VLTYDQRKTIQTLHEQGQNMAAIARAIGVHRSTVKRELDRNTVDGKYDAHMALVYTLGRKKAAAQENEPPVRYRGQKRKTEKRDKKKMLPLLRAKWQRRFYFSSWRLRKRRREFMRHRYGRQYSRSRRQLQYKRWYDREVRERNYAREIWRRELWDNILGRKRLKPSALWPACTKKDVKQKAKALKSNTKTPANRPPKALPKPNLNSHPVKRKIQKAKRLQSRKAASYGDMISRANSSKAPP
jgi:hypothetical protein